MAFKYKRRGDDAVEKRATQQGGNFESFIKDEYRVYSAKKGDHSIRILPRDEKEQAEHYGEDIYVHYSVGPDRASVLCPAKMANEACPVCEERARAERRGDEDATKELAAHRRVLLWLLDRKNEDQGPVLWSMPWTVDRDIAKVCKDRETGRYYFIDDPDQGYDVYFDVDGEGIQKKYSGYQLQKRPSSVAKKWLDYVEGNPLLDCLRWRDYDEILRLFEGGAKPEADRSAAPPRDDRHAGNGHAEPPPAREDERDPPPARGEDEDPRPAPARREPTPREPEPSREPDPAAVSGRSRADQLRERFAARK